MKESKRKKEKKKEKERKERSFLINFFSWIQGENEDESLSPMNINRLTKERQNFVKREQKISIEIPLKSGSTLGKRTANICAWAESTRLSSGG